MLRGKRIVITGGCGFIGSHLAGRLSEKNAVSIIDDLSTGKARNINGFRERLELQKASILNAKVVDRTLGGADIVFHLAAVASVFRSLKDPLETNRINVEGTLQMLDASRRSEVEKFVFVSSAAVYGENPKNPKKEDFETSACSPYAASKIAGEMYSKIFANLYGLETGIVRLFNVYGPRQSLETGYATVIPKFVSLMRGGKRPEIYGDGLQSRDFVHVEDVVEGLVLVAEKGKGGEVFNIASGKETTVLELAELLNKILGKELEPRHTAPIAGDVRRSIADVSKARKMLGFEAKYDLEKGLKKTVGYY